MIMRSIAAKLSNKDIEAVSQLHPGPALIEAQR
jgi:isochorismate synthase EntC